MTFKDFELGDFSIQATGMDGFLSEGEDYEPIIDYTGAPMQRRVASLRDLKGFTRIASDTLIRKSEKDLWSLKQTDDGDWVIERLFDDDGNPLTV